jgi:hypothetical protein
MKGLLSCRMLSLASALGLILTGLAAPTANAATSPLQALIDTPTSVAACVQPALSQPFAAASDTNYYALMPGESPDDFAATGWTLERGAKILTETLADGTTGSVLDLPSGSIAISPPMCVTSQYPTARTEIQDVAGAEGVFFYESYASTSGWGVPKNTGQVHGQGNAWTLSTSVNIQPGSAAGWQLVRFGLVAGGTKSDFRLYNLYVDPRMTD